MRSGGRTEGPAKETGPLRKRWEASDVGGEPKTAASRPQYYNTTECLLKISEIGKNTVCSFTECTVN